MYTEDAVYIRQWLQCLAHMRASAPRAVRFFRQVVLRERASFAGVERGQGRADRPECHGAGLVLSGDGGRGALSSVSARRRVTDGTCYNCLYCKTVLFLKHCDIRIAQRESSYPN